MSVIPLSLHSRRRGGRCRVGRLCGFRASVHRGVRSGPLSTDYAPPLRGGSSGERWLTVPVALALGALIIVVFALVGFCLARTRPRRARGAADDGRYWFAAAPPAPLVAGVPHLSATVVPGSPSAHRVLRLAPAYY